MQRYWISWYSGNYADEGCTKPPFQFWCSGSRDRKGEGDEQILCAVVDCIGRPDDNERDILLALKTYYPDFELRFIEEKDETWKPGDRFAVFEGRTGLGFFTVRTNGLA